MAFDDECDDDTMLMCVVHCAPLPKSKRMCAVSVNDKILIGFEPEINISSDVVFVAMK